MGFSSGHVTGQSLGKLTGVAALLRYPIDDECDEEDCAAVPAPAASASPIEVPEGKRKLDRQDAAPQREQAVALPAEELDGGKRTDSGAHDAKPAPKSAPPLRAAGRSCADAKAAAKQAGKSAGKTTSKGGGKLGGGGKKPKPVCPNMD